MRVLSLFSGIGLHDLGLERAGMSTVAFCEADSFCRAVLAKHWPEVPCFDDVRTLSAESLRSAGIERVDLVTGGFPCQDISVAGKGAGIEGQRSGLWAEMYRIVRELRPRWVLAENSPALRTRGADRVLGQLEALGYSCWPLVVAAQDVGATHRRKRVWIVAHRDGAELWELSGRSGRAGRKDSAEFGEYCEALADYYSERRELERRGERRVGDADSARLAKLRGERGDDGAELAPVERASRWPARPGEPQHWWEAPRLVESRLGRAVARCARRLDSFVRRNRLKALGGANPPQVVEAIGRAILAADQAMRVSIDGE